MTFIAEHFISLIEKAKELGKISEKEHERLRWIPIKTLDDSEYAFMEFTESMRNTLLERITKGAQYIEENGPIPVAVKRYDNLCEELERLDWRWSDARQDQTN
jgi:tyrosine-protein phosphatase YwqE